MSADAEFLAAAAIIVPPWHEATIATLRDIMADLAVCAKERRPCGHIGNVAACGKQLKRAIATLRERCASETAIALLEKGLDGLAAAWRDPTPASESSNLMFARERIAEGAYQLFGIKP